MAYINVRTYEILEQPEDQDLKEYFECDEMIAPIISLLNKKGYITRFCCEGHLYDTAMTSQMSFKDDKTPNAKNVCGYISHTELNDDSKHLYEVHIRRSAPSGYIAFEQYVNVEPFLDSFPEENVYASYGNNTIRWSYIEEKCKDFIDERKKELEMQANPFAFFKLKANYLSSIYEWVQSLPDYEDVITDLDKKNKFFLLNELSQIKEALDGKIDCDNSIPDFLDMYINNISMIDNDRENYNKMLSLDIDEKINYFNEVLKKSVITLDDGRKVFAFTTSLE